MRKAEEEKFSWSCKAELMEHDSNSASEDLKAHRSHACCKCLHTRHGEVLWTNIKKQTAIVASVIWQLRQTKAADLQFTHSTVPELFHSFLLK